MTRKMMYEERNSRFSSGQNPNVSKDWFGTAMRDANTKSEEQIRAIKAKREKEQRDKITAAARSKSWNDAQKNKKSMFESLNRIFKI